MKLSQKTKDFRFVSSILSFAFALIAAIIAVWLQARAYYKYGGLDSYSPMEVYTPGTIQLILGIMGIAAVLLGASKILPGSPELTDPELRDYDNSLVKKEPPASTPPGV